MSKGSKRRKQQVDDEVMRDNWDRIFNSETGNKKKRKKKDDQE